MAHTFSMYAYLLLLSFEPTRLWNLDTDNGNDISARACGPCVECECFWWDWTCCKWHGRVESMNSILKYWILKEQGRRMKEIKREREEDGTKKVRFLDVCQCMESLLSQQTSHILKMFVNRQDFFHHFYAQFFLFIFFSRIKRMPILYCVLNSQQIVCTIFQYPTKWRLHNSAVRCQNEKKKMKKWANKKLVFFSL